MTEILLVHQAASVSPVRALTLKGVASTTLELVEVAKVRRLSELLYSYNTHLNAQENTDKQLTYLADEAVMFVAETWLLYLCSSTPQLWPSRELHRTFSEVAKYVSVSTFISPV